MRDKRMYSFIGKVYVDDVPISGTWRAESYAVSESKARSNLKYRYRKENYYPENTPIDFVGKWVVS